MNLFGGKEKAAEPEPELPSKSDELMVRYNELLAKHNDTLQRLINVRQALDTLKQAADLVSAAQTAADKGVDPFWYKRVADSNLLLKQASNRAAQVLATV